MSWLCIIAHNLHTCIICTTFASFPRYANCSQRNLHKLGRICIQLFETGISQYWQQQTLWFVHLQSSKWSLVSNIQQETFHFSFWLHFNWKTLLSFLTKNCKSYHLFYPEKFNMWDWQTLSYKFRTQISDQVSDHVSDQIKFWWLCNVFMQNFHVAGNKFLEWIFPSTGWAVLLEKVKLWARSKSRWLLPRKRHQPRIVPLQVFPSFLYGLKDIK